VATNVLGKRRMQYELAGDELKKATVQLEANISKHKRIEEHIKRALTAIRSW
jgi:hypothetical protein